MPFFNQLNKGLTKQLWKYNFPWFMFDLYNKQLITSLQIPQSDITDSKDIILAEIPIPGLNYSPIQPVGSANRKISFTIPLVKRNNIVGNVLMLKQFENLRNNYNGIFGMLNDQFKGNPKVLYSWGTGSIPLVYYVKKCDFVHRSSFVNSFGQTQYSEISIELWLDEKDPIYKAEEIFRKTSSYLGMAQGITDVGMNVLNKLKIQI